MANKKEERATYHIEGCTIAGYIYSKEQAAVSQAIAKALGENAKALGQLALTLQPPGNVELGTGMFINGGDK